MSIGPWEERNMKTHLIRDGFSLSFYSRNENECLSQLGKLLDIPVFTRNGVEHTSYEYNTGRRPAIHETSFAVPPSEGTRIRNVLKQLLPEYKEDQNIQTAVNCVKKL
jgi:hypothetical protein